MNKNKKIIADLLFIIITVSVCSYYYRFAFAKTDKLNIDDIKMLCADADYIEFSWLEYRRAEVSITVEADKLNELIDLISNIDVITVDGVPSGRRTSQQTLRYCASVESEKHGTLFRIYTDEGFILLEPRGLEGRSVSYIIPEKYYSDRDRDILRDYVQKNIMNDYTGMLERENVSSARTGYKWEYVEYADGEVVDLKTK